MKIVAAVGFVRVSLRVLGEVASLGGQLAQGYGRSGTTCSGFFHLSYLLSNVRQRARCCCYLPQLGWPAQLADAAESHAHMDRLHQRRRGSCRIG